MQNRLMVGIFLFLCIMMVGGGDALWAKEREEMVVVLHGIAKTSASMKPVEDILHKEGYNTLNITYPSTVKNLDGIAQSLRENTFNAEIWKDYNKIHIVTHSMGGLVARRYLDLYKEDIPKEKLGQVVMLAPPNGGSDIADLIHDFWLYEWFYGPAGQELTTEVQSKIDHDIYYNLGIIAGTKEWPYFIAAFILPGKSDGRVTVQKTKLEDMRDYVAVKGTHMFIMNKPSVHKQILYFLKNARPLHNA